MTGWTRQAVLETAAAWRYVPPDAVIEESQHIRLVSAWGHVFVHRAEGLLPDGLIAEARTLAGTRTTRWVTHDLTEPPALVPSLVAAGASIGADLDILVLDLAGGAPDIPVPPGVRAEVVDTPERLGHVFDIDSQAFGSPPATAVAREAGEREVVEQAAAGRGRTSFRYLGYIGDVPVGAGGMTLEQTAHGTLAKLWGTGVLEAYRGRGVYRAIVAARLAEAVARGVEIALVKALTGTSGPILRRVGFVEYGHERQYDLPPTRI